MLQHGCEKQWQAATVQKKWGELHPDEKGSKSPSPRARANQDSRYTTVSTEGEDFPQEEYVSGNTNGNTVGNGNGDGKRVNHMQWIHRGSEGEFQVQSATRETFAGHDGLPSVEQQESWPSRQPGRDQLL
jgi:hypothetical protein